MKITYIGHSGFLMEWDTCYWLFDYYQGTIPPLNPEKKLIVFASHRHHDHFNPEIFKLPHPQQLTEYVLSSDIHITEEKLVNYGARPETGEHILMVNPRRTYEIYDLNHKIIEVKTLKSTDEGVAFLIQYEEKVIYHAGDLNLWWWKEETKEYNHNMKALFCKEIETLSGVSIDVAFAPLDPRQEEYFSLGIQQLAKTAEVKYLFPMHMWEDKQVIHRLIEEGSVPEGVTLIEVEQGQEWIVGPELG